MRVAVEPIDAVRRVSTDDQPTLPQHPYEFALYYDT